MALSIAAAGMLSDRAGPIAALTREHVGWGQAEGLFTAGARSRVERLVLAQGDGTRRLTKSAPRFSATQSPRTPLISRAVFCVG